MSKKPIDTKVILMLLVPFVGMIGLAYLLFKDKPTVSAIDVVGFVTGALIPVVGYLMEILNKYSTTFFVATSRLRSLFAHEPMRWDISANFTIDKPTKSTKEILDRVIVALRERSANRSAEFKVVPLESTAYEIITGEGPTLKMKINHDDGGSEVNSGWSLHLTVDNYRVGYNQVKAIIIYEIMPVLETIQNAVKSHDSRYSLTVSFPKQGNPFFGFFVAQLPAKIVTTFDVRLNFDDLSSRIDISKDKLRLNSTSQNSFRELAVEFLAFSNTLGDKLKHV